MFFSLVIKTNRQRYEGVSRETVPTVLPPAGPAAMNEGALAELCAIGDRAALDELS